MTEDRYIIEVKKLRSQMVAVAARYLDNPDEAEDITQDALLKLWAMREILRESEVDRLAFTILKHLCVNELKRREYRRANLSVDIDSIDVAMETDNPQEIEEREQQLMAAVNKLPSRQRLLLEMRYIKGKDVRTISVLTGSSEESINMALSRARSKVYKIMAAVVVAVVLALFSMLWDYDANKDIIADVPIKIENNHKEESQEIVEKLSLSQVGNNNMTVVKYKKHSTGAKCKKQIDEEIALAEMQQYYQQVISESYKLVMAEQDTNPDFDALCAYAYAQTAALSEELAGQRSEEMTSKENSTNKFDDF